MNVNWVGSFLLVNDFFDYYFSEVGVTILVLQLSFSCLVIDHTISAVERNSYCDVRILIRIVLILIVFVVLSAVLIVIWLTFLSVPVGVLDTIGVVSVVRKCYG